MPGFSESDASSAPLEPRVPPPALQAGRARTSRPEPEIPTLNYDQRPPATMNAPKAHSRRGPVNQQPMDSKKMYLNLRNAADMPVGQDGQRDWSNNIFEYTDKGAVVRAAFCPCVVYARNAARWDHLDRHEAPHPLPGNNYAQCCGHACASLCLFSCFLNMCARSKVRERYDIRGSGGEDCANSWALYPCALHQEERELELEENAMRDMGVDGKELYEDDGVGDRDRAPGFCNPCVPTSGPIGGNGCSCFLCCFMC